MREEDLKKFDVPTLIIHGDDDSDRPDRRLRPAFLQADQNARLEVYKGAPHGLCSTHKDRVNADLLAFIRA